MVEPWWSVPVVLSLGGALGWWAARSRRLRGELHQHRALSSNYFRGLNYLLNEQPDKAIEVFLKLAEINRETVETHLALGNLFRRRGEMDKAIQFHRHIISRSDLNERHRLRALLELGEDYMRAGLLDRAEELFAELAAHDDYAETASRQLLLIYQQEKDWRKAIAQAERLRSLGDDEAPAKMAQFNCELAETTWESGDERAAMEYLETARRLNPRCTRVLLTEAVFHAKRQNWQQAARAYQQACELDPDLIVVAIDSLNICFTSMGREAELLDWLQALAEKARTLAPVLAYASIKARREPDAAIHYLLEQMHKRPTARGLYQLLELMQGHGHRVSELDPELLRRLMRRVLKEQPRFRCRQCGFSGQTWHWQCPSCREWETTRPVSGVLGE